MYMETHTRSLIKTVSYRLLATLLTSLLVWIFAGKLQVALAVGGLDGVTKLVLFFMHERMWDRIRHGRREIKPSVIWLTGLSGAGKTTIARSLQQAMATRGWKVECLDGDSIRDLFPSTGFSRPDRDAHVQRVGYLASRLEAHGVFVIVSLISPYRESRDFVRKLCKNFFEVHVATAIEECERRDVKGLYARARRGEIKQFTGVDDPYEPPLHPELSIDTKGVPVEQISNKIMNQLGA